MKKLDHWIQAMVESAGETAEIQLSEKHCKMISTPNALPKPGGLFGSFIDANLGGNLYRFFLLSDAAGCSKIAEAFFKVALDDQDNWLPDFDVADAVGEVTNQIVGGVLRRVITGDTEITLSTPVYIDGSFSKPEKSTFVSKVIEIGNSLNTIGIATYDKSDLIG